MIECFGFTSMVFFETMYEVIELSRNAWAFMMRSMFADQPYSDVVSTHGESTIRELTSTFSTLSPRTSAFCPRTLSAAAQRTHPRGRPCTRPRGPSSGDFRGTATMTPEPRSHP